MPSGAAAPGQSLMAGLPRDLRLTALTVTVRNAPPGLLDDAGAGVLTLRTAGAFEAVRPVFVNDALSVHLIRAGAYRVEGIAGYRCRDLFLDLPPGDAPLALGGLVLDVFDETEATLSGTLPTRDDLARIATLTGEPEDAIVSEPLERRSGVPCRRDPRAASRPDIDPTFKQLTPAEMATIGALTLMFGGIAGAAIATGTFVFLAGTGGGFLFLGF
jgi:hypothetical protein